MIGFAMNKKPLERNDPMEIMVAEAFTEAGIAWVDDLETGLDFYLPDYEVYVEVKRMHSARISEQMLRRPDVIAVQGLQAVKTLCHLLTRNAP
jgi:hypothetical protein